MESVLIVITLGSLAMTIALALLLARLVRAERRRSDARVAMLRDLADDTARQQRGARESGGGLGSRRSRDG